MYRNPAAGFYMTGMMLSKIWQTVQSPRGPGSELDLLDEIDCTNAYLVAAMYFSRRLEKLWQRSCAVSMWISKRPHTTVCIFDWRTLTLFWPFENNTAPYSDNALTR